MTSTAWLTVRCASYYPISYTHKSNRQNDSEDRSYPVQVQLDLTAGIDGCLLATQLHDFAQDAHCLVGELLEIWRADSWG